MTRKVSTAICYSTRSQWSKTFKLTGSFNYCLDLTPPWAQRFEGSHSSSLFVILNQLCFANSNKFAMS